MLDCLSLVVELFALAEADLHLHAAVLEIEAQRDERQPVLLHAREAAEWIRPDTTETKEIIMRSLTGMLFERVE